MNTTESEATAPRTILELLEERARKQPEQDAFQVIRDKQVSGMSYSLWLSQARCFASGLLELGLSAGSGVAMISRSRPEWCIMDAANLMVGAVSVPLFRGDLPRRHLALMQRAKVELICVEGPKELRSLLGMREHLPAVRKVIVFDDVALNREGEEISVKGLVPPEAQDWVISLERLEALGQRTLEANDAELRHRR